jgi:hypothetical protein
LTPFGLAWFVGVRAGGTREDTGCEDQLKGGFRVDGKGRKDLGNSVSRGGGRGAGVAGWVRGAEGPGTWRGGALGRFSGGSGDALVIVCVRGCGRRGRIRGEVGCAVTAN